MESMKNTLIKVLVVILAVLVMNTNALAATTEYYGGYSGANNLFPNYTSLNNVRNNNPNGINYIASNTLTDIRIVLSANTAYAQGAFIVNGANGFAGGTIEFTGRTTATDPNTKKALTIVSHDTAPLIQSYRFLNITGGTVASDTHLILDNVTLNQFGYYSATNANSGNAGSTIYLQNGNLTIGTAANKDAVTTFSQNHNGWLYNNTLYGGNGTVTLSNGKATFNNKVVFDTNKALHGSAVYVTGVGRQGGVATNPWNNAVVFNSDATFIKNDADFSFGTVFVGSSGGNVIFNGEAYFEGNSAARGTAVYVENGGDIIFRGDAVFKDNIATGRAWTASATDG